jgi:hypothetical protein
MHLFAKFTKSFFAKFSFKGSGTLAFALALRQNLSPFTVLTTPRAEARGFLKSPLSMRGSSCERKLSLAGNVLGCVNVSVVRRTAQTSPLPYSKTCYPFRGEILSRAFLLVDY